MNTNRVPRSLLATEVGWCDRVKVAMAAKSSALELFGGAPTTTVPATATVPTKQQPLTSGNLWQLVNGKAGVTSGGAGGASADDFFGAPPVTHQ